MISAKTFPGQGIFHENKTTMITKELLGKNAPFLILAAAFCLAGCATTDQNTTAKSPDTAASRSGIPARYRSPDGRDIVIGPSSAANGGLVFKEPHMERCWLANNFNFTGYDVVYIAPTLSTAKFQADEVAPHELAKQNLPLELQREFEMRGIFPKIVTSELGIPVGAHVLKLENTIVEYKKGGGAARYWVGMYGGGQPMARPDRGVAAPRVVDDLRRSGRRDDRVQHRSVREVPRQQIGVDRERVGLACLERNCAKKVNLKETHGGPWTAPLYVTRRAGIVWAA